MPEGWKPDKPFDYLIVMEDFHIGGWLFTKGQHVRSNHPAANKLLYECSDEYECSNQFVHPVRLAELNPGRYA